MSDYEQEYSLPQSTDQIPHADAQTETLEVAQKTNRDSTLKWAKRGLAAVALSGIAYGGVQSALHFEEVKEDIVEQDAWAAPALMVTETAALSGAVLMVGAMGAKKNLRNITSAIKDAPGYMDQLNDNKVFKNGLRLNMAGATGTAGVFTAAAEALPENVWTLAYGVAAGSIALSGIPIWAADKFVRINREEEQ